MYDIHDIEQGKTYACKFKIEIMLDTLGRPMGIDDTPFDAPGLYEGIGVIKIRDIENKQVTGIRKTHSKWGEIKIINNKVDALNMMQNLRI